MKTPGPNCKIIANIPESWRRKKGFKYSLCIGAKYQNIIGCKT